MKKVVCVITLVGFLFSACTSLQMVSFDRLQAADVNYPELVRRVGVVNHAPVALSLAENDSLSSLEADGQVVAEALAQGIAASNYFDQVVIGDSALSNSENGRASVLSQEEADELIRSMGVDMLFSIDRINVLLKKEAYMGYSEDLNWVPMTDAVISPVLVAHVYGRPPLFSVSKSDTLCWEVNSALTYERIARESAEYAAGLLADCLLPQWTEQQRFYFDGGNVEMHEVLGDENMFLFGLHADEVQALKREGYVPQRLYTRDETLRRCLDALRTGFRDGVTYEDLYQRLLFGSGGSAADEYLLLADFHTYRQAEERMAKTYADPAAWNRMSLLNIARSGIFAADRAVAEYAENIWHVPHK